MKSHAQAVVIGGGVVGCSVLYHLTKAGWRDVVLIERDQLTSGSTWHAAGTTHAYAKSARIAGAEIQLQTRVTDLQPRPDGSWDVVTTAGTIRADHVVNCGGLWAREVGRMVGLELPVLAMEHMYLVTEDMPEVIAFNKEAGHELPHAIDFKAEIYMRQE